MNSRNRGSPLLQVRWQDRPERAGTRNHPRELGFSSWYPLLDYLRTGPQEEFESSSSNQHKAALIKGGCFMIDQQLPGERPGIVKFPGRLNASRRQLPTSPYEECNHSSRFISFQWQLVHRSVLGDVQPLAISTNHHGKWIPIKATRIGIHRSAR